MTDNQLPAPVALDAKAVRRLIDNFESIVGDWTMEQRASIGSHKNPLADKLAAARRELTAALAHPAALSGGNSEPAATHRTAGETIGGGDGESDFIAEAISEAYGERCPEFDAGCFACRAWKQYDDLTALAPPPVEPAQGVTEALRKVRSLLEVEYHDDGRIACVAHASGGLREVVAILDAALAAAPEGSGGSNG